MAKKKSSKSKTKSAQQDDQEHFEKWLRATMTPLAQPHWIEKKRMAEYQASPGANGSVFLQHTPRRMKHAAMEPPRVSYAFSLGDAVHIATLEPERFDKIQGEEEFFQYVPGGTGLKSKAAKEAFKADPSRPMVTPELISKARYMRDAILENDFARLILSPPADKELSGFVWDPDAQVIRKIRLDFSPKKGNYDLDIKTCDSCDEYAFWASIKKFKYGAKCAYYQDTAAMIRGTLPRPYFYLVAVSGPKGESKGVYDAPYECQVFEIASPVDELSLMAEGRAFYMDRLSKFSNAAHTNHWEAWQHQQGACVLTKFPPRAIFKSTQTEDHEEEER